MLAVQQPTSASVGNGTYSYSASYDNALRFKTANLSLASDDTRLYRYASVRGNSETATDPTGHRCTVDTCGGGGSTGGCGTTCGDGHPGHAGCGDTCGCDKSCRRPPPPGGCKAKGSGPNPLQLERLRASALHAIWEFQDILDKLDGLHGWLDHLLSILPSLTGVAQAFLDNIWHAFSALDFEFHLIQSWYRNQYTLWTPSDWNVGNVVAFNSLIHLFMLSTAVAAAVLATALEALPAALAENPVLAGIVAVVVEPSAVVWETVVIGINVYAQNIVTEAMDRQVEILSGNGSA
jgi:hypothetical protein